MNSHDYTDAMARAFVFPSPTGVNHYELEVFTFHERLLSFRPQQGVTYYE